MPHKVRGANDPSIRKACERSWEVANSQAYVYLYSDYARLLTAYGDSIHSGYSEMYPTLQFTSSPKREGKQRPVLTIEPSSPQRGLA